MTLPVNSRQIDLTSRLLIQQPAAAVTRDRVAILPLVIQQAMDSTMSSPAGRRSTATGMHPPTASVAAAHAAANEAAGKQAPRASRQYRHITYEKYTTASTT